jgi:hypothetical protein
MRKTIHRAWWRIGLRAAVIAALLGLAVNGEAQQAFTPLDAARQALGQMEDMLAAQRLDAGWAQNLAAMRVSVRNVKGFSEYVVEFRRSAGSPPSVELYFSMSGEPTGSSLETD